MKNEKLNLLLFVLLCLVAGGTVFYFATDRDLSSTPIPADPTGDGLFYTGGVNPDDAVPDSAQDVCNAIALLISYLPDEKDRNEMVGHAKTFANVGGDVSAPVIIPTDATKRSVVFAFMQALVDKYIASLQSIVAIIDDPVISGNINAGMTEALANLNNAKAGARIGTMTTPVVDPAYLDMARTINAALAAQKSSERWTNGFTDMQREPVNNFASWALWLVDLYHWAIISATNTLQIAIYAIKAEDDAAIAAYSQPDMMNRMVQNTDDAVKLKQDFAYLQDRRAGGAYSFALADRQRGEIRANVNHSDRLAIYRANLRLFIIGQRQIAYIAESIAKQSGDESYKGKSGGGFNLAKIVGGVIMAKSAS